jgi:crotonobetainyl-CoA:carnitine CoA-transferase CaiB-like acyl-CoA transferase
MTDRIPRGPLAGITVVDFTRVLSGPYCTMLLADMGARVIKIERPGQGDDTRAWGPPFLAGESAYFLSINRNKESLTLDFKHREGRDLLERLVEKADVVVENFRPGTLDRVGLGYQDLAARCPRLVYCSISGFGQTGPRRDEPGYDAVIQAESGLMSITGAADGPPYRLGVAIADIVAGMFAAQGVLLALYARGQTGRGQLVDLGMLDAATALLTYQAGIYLGAGLIPGRLGNRHPSIVPYETFDAADGEFVIAVGNDHQWRAFCRVLGLEHLASDPSFDTNRKRVEGRDALHAVLQARLRTKPSGHWIEALTREGIPSGSVRTIDQALDDPQVGARGMIASMTHPVAGLIKVLGVPVKLSETPGSVRTPPPTLGQHTERILTADLGMSTEEIARLKREGVV